MLRPALIEQEPDAIYVALVAALFDIEGPTFLAGLLYALLGTYLTVVLGDPVTAGLTIAGTLAIVPRILLLRAYRRRRGIAGAGIDDAGTAATWELRYCMGLILFAVLVSGVGLRMFEIGTPPLQMLALTMLFGFCAGIVARVAVRPLVCLLAVCVTIVPTILAAALSDAPHHRALAFGIAFFLCGAFGTIRHAYCAARHHITIAHDMAAVARNDPLTGLLNRLGLRQAFLERADAGGTLVAVHYLDLDRFKPVNDRHGHSAGDAVLDQVARRIRDMLRPTDLAARIGGDEFVVIQSPARDPDDVRAFAAAITALFDAPYPVAGVQVRVGTSVGSALATTPRPDLDRLLAEADRALYAAKLAGRTMDV